MISMMMLDRWEEAEKYAQLSKKWLVENAELSQTASHLIYHGIREQFTKGRKLFQEQFAYTFKNSSDLNRYKFFLGAQVFFDRLLQSGSETVKLKLTENKNLYNESDVYPVEELLQYAKCQVQALGDALDKRNGNDHYNKHTLHLLSRYGSVVKPD